MAVAVARVHIKPIQFGKRSQCIGEFPSALLA